MSILPVSVAMLLVMGMGALARRRGWIDGAATAGLSRLAIDAAFPALVLAQLARTVTAEQLARGFYVPLLGAGVIALGLLVGRLLVPLFVPAERAVERRTFVFLVAVTNWIFLPLAIARERYGADGVQAVLLLNVGVQPVVWTLALSALRGDAQGDQPLAARLREVLLNPGILATVGGIAIALLLPGWANGPSLSARTLIPATQLLGDLTVPLSLLVTGSHLAGIPLDRHLPDRPVLGILLARLAVVPALTWLALQAASRVGATLLPVPAQVTLLVAAMPTAVSCALFTERYGGDVALATRAIFHSTILGLLTVSALAALL